MVIDISLPIPYLKILGLKLRAKMRSANQIAGFFKMYYLKKEVNGKVYLWLSDKYWSLLQVNTIILAVYNQVCPKYPRYVFLSLKNFQKSMEDEVDFLPADKHKSFLQVDIITLTVHSEVFP